MKSSTLFAAALLFPGLACSASSSGGSPDLAASGQSSGAADSSTASGASPSSGASTSNDGSASSDASPVEASVIGDGGIPTITMPRISAGGPAFASEMGSSSNPSSANDNSMTTAWAPTQLPAWIAYDLSKAPSSQRQSVLVVWNAEHAGTYINATPPSGAQMPTAYTIETNVAPGGTSSAPTTGWVKVASVTDNLRNTVEHAVALAGGNWVRMSVTASTDASVAIDLDVFSTPYGPTDCWMLMGDSITAITMGYAFSNLPQLVNQMRSDRWPAVIDAAIGGTNTTAAVGAIDDTLAGYPGRYVALAYGTNDHANDFQLETLVEKVLAAGKIPVVPHMPWSDSAGTNGVMINQEIDALYAKYPQILRGPDLWAVFLNRTDLIPAGDIHPNAAGQDVLRKQWAAAMSAVP